MKITSANVPTDTPALSRSSAATASAPAAAPTAAAGAPAALQSGSLTPALEALRALPDFDAARVAELRDALAKGELPFDPARLAGLITHFHGSGK